MRKKGFLLILKKYILVLTLFLLSEISYAREIKGQVIADNGVLLAGTTVSLFENSNKSSQALQSVKVDEAGKFVLDCADSCWVSAQQMTDGAGRALSWRFQVPNEINYVRLQLSAERVITVDASVPEKGSYYITYLNLDTLDQDAQVTS